MKSVGSASDDHAGMDAFSAAGAASMRVNPVSARRAAEKPPAPQAGPPRRFDPHAIVQAESLILSVTYMLCGLLGVVVLDQLGRTTGAYAFAHWRLWAVLFPAGLAMMPFRRAHQFTDAFALEAMALIGLAMRSACVALVLQTLLWLANIERIPAWLLATVVFTHVLFGWGGRVLFLRLTRHWRRKLRVAIIGVGEQGRAIAEHLQASSDDVEVVGFADDRHTRIDTAGLGAPFLGSVADLCARDHGIDAVMLAIPNTAAQRIESLTLFIRRNVVDVYLAPEAALLRLASRPDTDGALDTGMRLNLNMLSLYGRISKRLFDIVFSALAMLLFLPLCLVIAALIKLESPGPAIFKQPRFGRGNYLFNVYKFRSMRFDAAPRDGEIRLTERGDARVTRIGDFLRRTSLDELPQFLNVLLGDMSVVGPRPHPPGVKAGERIYEDVVPGFMERYTIRPGITGWAQVKGLRGNTFTEKHVIERFACDVQYIRNWSLELDLWIVLKTIKGGFGGKNAF